MNPLVHTELSWLLAQPLARRRDRILVTLAGVLPDLDGLSLLAGQDAYSDWHHVVCHGWLFALLVALTAVAFAQARWATAILAFAAAHLHYACDLAGSGDRALGGDGWPLYYLWPFSRTAWAWNGQWDLASWQNTLIGLVATLACLALALPFGRTVVELFSLRADQHVVKALRARFARAKSPVNPHT